jgi:arylsulfatase A-like enzyme
LLLLLLGACGGGTEPTVEAPLRPHIFLISLDTLRQDHVGFHGYERDTTPVLDELARSSLIFERAYTTASFTLIAHMSLLTGMYPNQHGVLKPRTLLPEEIPTLAQRLEAEGYHTMGFYFPGWLDETYGFGRGYDHYESHRTAEEAEEHLLAGLDQAPEDEPLFCFVHLFDIHNAPLGRNQGVVYDPPDPYGQCFVEDARERLATLDGREIWRKDGTGVSESQHEAIVGMYDGGIRYVDTKLGEWIEELRGRGLFEGSLFIVTSDHGEGLLQRTSSYGGHGGTFEEGLLVPFLVRFPDGRFAGERVAEPVSHVDLMPTLLAYLGLSADERLPGFSLLDGRPPRVPVFAERPGTDTTIHWPWKLVQRTGDERSTLYNLEQDPRETRNLLLRSSRQEYAERLESLRELSEHCLERRFQPQEAAATTESASEETRKLLRDLGYADGG